MKTRFTIIPTGEALVPRYEHFTLTQEEIEKEKKDPTLWIPCYCLLIQHPELGNILYDTGADVDWQKRYPEGMKQMYPVIKVFDLKEGLSKVGLYPDDIDMIIMSHLHWDHAGNLRMFSGTKAGKNIYVAEEEFKFALMSTNMHDYSENRYYEDGYFRKDFNNIEGLEYKLVKEDMKLADDISLHLFPGHTTAVMGIEIRTEHEGNVIFPSDSVYNSVNYGPPVHLPGLCFMADEYAKSVEKIHNIAERDNAKVFFSHDWDKFQTYKKVPEWYD